MFINERAKAIASDALPAYRLLPLSSDNQPSFPEELPMADSVKDKIKDAGEAVKNAGNKAGEAAGKAAEWTKEKAREAGDKIEEAGDAAKKKIDNATS
jgi:hypothetical protein